MMMMMMITLRSSSKQRCTGLLARGVLLATATAEQIAVIVAAELTTDELFLFTCHKKLNVPGNQRNR